MDLGKVPSQSLEEAASWCVKARWQPTYRALSHVSSEVIVLDQKDFKK